tara:strand:- start:872 stop:1615 length:744 start_codon:yes stop_codon:yes gene_type:complete
MGKKSSSGADVVGAAQAEGEFAREIAREGSYADRPDQFNPFGSSTWGQEQIKDPASGEMVTKWTQNQQLNSQSQNLLDSEMGNNQQLSNMQGNAFSRAGQEMGQPLDWDQFGDVVDFDPTANRQEAEDASYGRATSRLDPRFAQQRATMETQMANRGLRAGDSAYDKAMGNFGRTENDAYEQAQMGAVGQGREEVGMNLQTNERANALRQKEIDEYLGKRGQSLSEAERLGANKNYQEVTSAFGGGS